MKPFWVLLSIHTITTIIVITSCTVLVLRNRNTEEISIGGRVAVWSSLFAAISNLYLLRGWMKKEIKSGPQDWSNILALMAVVLPNLILVSCRRMPPIWLLGVTSFQMMSGTQSLLMNLEKCFKHSRNVILSMLASFFGLLLVFSTRLMPFGQGRTTVMVVGLALLTSTFLGIGWRVQAFVLRWIEVCKNDDREKDELLKVIWNCGTYFVYVGAFVLASSIFQWKQMHAPCDDEITVYVWIQLIPIILRAIFHDMITSMDTEAAVAIAIKLNRGFVRYISHELRSHLNHMSADIYTLRHERDVAGTRQGRQRVLAGMQQACDSSVGILDDVLIFDKLRDSWEVKEKTWSLLDVKVLLRKVVDELSPQVGRNKHQTLICFFNTLIAVAANKSIISR